MVDEMAETALDLVVAGTGDAVMMVESEAKELSEKQMLDAVMFGHRGFQPVIQAIIKLAEKAAREPWDFQPPDKSKYAGKMKATAEAELRRAFAITQKQERYQAVAAVKDRVMKELMPADADSNEQVLLGDVFKGLEQEVVRGDILRTSKRIDGRDLKTVRPIRSEVHVLPRAHGSALFTRGETQALVVATLGTGEDEQYVDALEGTRKERFLLHYNFPPYSVGETGRMGGPGRREIGHGKLAWRAVHPLMPSAEEFPYTVRIVSEITESNGSSSMASVCGSSLALMDAGVPLKRPVAGIAMGLIKEGNSYAVLSDILGDEDHLGDMDFKVAGTEKGVTSLQMDIKITGITEEIMRVALEQAQEGRMHILGEMGKAIDSARTELGEHAPRIETIKIPVDKIREVIGSGGSVIREIVAESGAKIDIEDDGTIKIAAAKREAIEAALEPHQGDNVGARGRPDLQGQGRQDHGVRRLRELLRRQGRPGAHLPADPGSAGNRAGGRQGRSAGLRQAVGLRRPRQGAPLHEDHRPADRQGDPAPGGRAGGGAAPPRASAAARPRRPSPPARAGLRPSDVGRQNKRDRFIPGLVPGIHLSACSGIR